MTNVLFVVAGMVVALICGHTVQRVLNTRRQFQLIAAAQPLGLRYVKEVIREPELRWPFLKSQVSADPHVDEFLEGKIRDCPAVLLSVRLATVVPEIQLLAALRRNEGDDSWLVLSHPERLSPERLGEIWNDLKEASSR